jgi:cell wall-associated NlpC family hydrolase
MAVYAQFGYKLPHETIAQSKSGYEVPMSALQPGDLIYYLGSSGLIGHVALYTGNGMVVHASSPSAGIKTSVYNYRTPYKAIRIIK